MTGIKTATVEALTAEVRVLMVGSRQITLSVVRQLDEVSPEDIEPFGRVRAAKQPRVHDIEVVGSADGVLAYAVAGMTVYRCGTEVGGNRCNDHLAMLAEVELSPLAVRVTPKAEITEPYWLCDLGGKFNYRRVEHGLFWQAHAWHICHPDDETYRKWQALPLIVLAGLR